jgi:hypothetical protein
MSLDGIGAGYLSQAFIAVNIKDSQSTGYFVLALDALRARDGAREGHILLRRVAVRSGLLWDDDASHIGHRWMNKGEQFVDSSEILVQATEAIRGRGAGLSAQAAVQERRSAIAQACVKAWVRMLFLQSIEHPVLQGHHSAFIEALHWQLRLVESLFGCGGHGPTEEEHTQRVAVDTSTYRRGP